MSRFCQNSIVDVLLHVISVDLWWQAREVMDAMQKDADFSQVQLLKVDGGASNNNLLMQMQADALQVSSHLASQATHLREHRLCHQLAKRVATLSCCK